MLALACLLLIPHVPASGQSSNPIIAGDHPDPTILRIGSTYWTTSTSGDWEPVFSLFRSTDLRHWQPAGAVFPIAPAWASGDFWAPELVQAPHGVAVFYAARKKNGPLCVAVATAPRANGPYTDHGPIVCQSDGSIDPSTVSDTNGHPFLIWKEDGNSIGKPTPIWAQPLTPDLLHVTGEKFELIQNDPASWEGGVVEGPYIMRHAGRFYLFYASNACCGTACHYAEGVARADRLRGPWTKDPANPIIRPNKYWRCPGHGTAVTAPDGKDYFIYHAYPAAAFVYLGRESVLDAITWTSDGWPVVDNNHGPSGDAEKDLPAPIEETFRSTELDPEWKWPIGHQPHLHTGNGVLTIQAEGSAGPAFVAHSLPSLDFEAIAAVPPDATAASGLGLVGEPERELTIFRRGANVALLCIDGNQRETIATAQVPTSRTIWLRIVSGANHVASFSYSTDDGRNWTLLGQSAQTAKMLAWDHGLRLALVADGSAGTEARFTHNDIDSLIANSTTQIRQHVD